MVFTLSKPSLRTFLVRCSSLLALCWARLLPRSNTLAFRLLDDFAESGMWLGRWIGFGLSGSTELRRSRLYTHETEDGETSSVISELASRAVLRVSWSLKRKNNSRSGNEMKNGAESQRYELDTLGTLTVPHMCPMCSYLPGSTVNVLVFMPPDGFLARLWMCLCAG